MLVRFPVPAACAKAYQHVQTPDGTWRSICLHCFLTAATATTRRDLEDGEKKHNCGDTIQDRGAA